MDHITDKDIDRLSGETGARLRQEKKVRITVIDDGTGMPWTGAINGCILCMERGRELEVPESIAALIALNEQVDYMSTRTLSDYKKGSGKNMTAGRARK